jgi:uncharacterized repeat protein (TIGR03803 family)
MHIRQALTTCGALLTAILLWMPNSAAQSAKPTLTTLYSFQGPSAQPPDGWIREGVVIGSGGKLYGTTEYGGAYGACVPHCGEPGFGTVFELTPPSGPGGAWSETVLLNFSGGNDGFNPTAGVAIGKGGVLYGTTLYKEYRSSCGTVFALIPPTLPGGAWTQNVLHRFARTGGEGCGPYTGVVVGDNGVVYGTTVSGGSSDDGTVFALSPPASPGGSWSMRTLHNFTGAPGDGYAPNGLLIGRDGGLYGTTQGGGTGPCTDPFSGCGTVFSLAPPASPGGAWTEEVLYNFMGAFGDGALPLGSPVMGSGPGGRPALYGATTYGGNGPCAVLTNGCGTVFSLTGPASPGGAWTEAVLYNFNGPPGDGAYPASGLVIGNGPSTEAVLYGTTLHGSSNAGTVFSLTPPSSPGGAWTETVLYALPDSSAGPDGTLAIGSGPGGHPLLYGTTQGGGTPDGLGTVFSLQP